MKKLVFALLLLAASAAQADIFRPWAPADRRTDFIGAAADTKPTSNVKRGSKAVEYDTNKIYRWSGREDQGASTDWKELYDGVTLGTYLSGERNASSTTGTDYMSMSPECKSSGELDLSSGSATIYNGPALICGFMISTTIGTAASSIDDNATAKIPLPVSFPVGVYQAFGTIVATSLKYTRGASGTGKIVVWYRPLDTTRTGW